MYYVYIMYMPSILGLILFKYENQILGFLISMNCNLVTAQYHFFENDLLEKMSKDTCVGGEEFI